MAPFYNVERDSTMAQKQIQSVDRAVRILKALGQHPGRLGLGDLAERVGLAKTTVHGLLRTLQEHGLVEQHLDTDKYQLGPELLQLGNSYLDLNELRSRSLAWRSEDGNWVWTFVLEEHDGTTRLISRNRFRLPTLAARIGMLPMEPASLLMEQRMLRGIKERAERLASASSPGS
jgi:DNA-binding IclR family transcriptional regulator